MKIVTGMILAAAFLLQSAPVLAGPEAGAVSEENPATPVAPPPAVVPEGPTDRGLRWKNAAVIGGIAATVGIYGATNWWEDGFSGSFQTVNEGWFGQDTYEGGADKAGHAYGTYTLTRLLTRTFEAVGNDPGRALRLGTWTSLGVMTAVEVVDGFSKKFRFSMGDVVMNTAGAAFAVLSEVVPGVDALLDFRLLYQRDDYVQQTGAANPGSDYSGQTFLLVMKADGIPRVREIPVMRYLEFEVGYNARGYEPNDSTDPQRRICYGIGINLSRLLSDTVFRGDLKGGKIQRGTDTVLEYLEVPWTAARTYRTF
ncbi:MAG: YfiM family protein [Deltaproteobacteria bacterium]|nr:YfiM family protein [Candidatus Deferrimicrobium borealis]